MGLLERGVSESSDDIDIRPLEFGDLRRKHNDMTADEDENYFDQNETCSRFFSVVMGLKLKKGLALHSNHTSQAKNAWKSAAVKVLSLEDPWERFHLDEYPTERAKRYRFHALKNCWVADDVFVKMELKSFSHGAMRECFRMKKLSNFAKIYDWSRAHNYVAKRYAKAETPRETYFEDVKLQMDAKLWGEEFNRHNPPKKVDIFQMAVLEMTERVGKPLYHVEHYIEGNYVKYNSNSGFVFSDTLRMTPQAFSHFTFERSGHELIVVDIQGVGDLYTDPQIHTASGTDYGDGNLGTRGMALFFHSHICNSICKSLGLTQFDLASSEIDACHKMIYSQRCYRTEIRGTEEQVVSPSELEREYIQEYIRMRSFSSGYFSNEERERIDSTSSVGSVDSVDSFDDLNPVMSVEGEEPLCDSLPKASRLCRLRQDSTSDFWENTESKEMAWKSFNDLLQKKARPSRIVGEEDHVRMLDTLNEKVEHIENNAVLGHIHLDLAKYHELNRFVEEDACYDREAAMFHLEFAAKCNNLESILAMAQIHLGLSHDVLPDIEIVEEERDLSVGFDYLLKAANCGDRSAMIRVAKTLDTGFGIPCSKEVNWPEAVYWYSSAVNTDCSDRDGNFDGTMDDPVYQLVARQAELYLQGGHSLDEDPNRARELFTRAADLAMESQKGKLAAKYYAKAEEALARVEG